MSDLPPIADITVGDLQNSFAGLAQNHPRKFALTFPRYDEVSAAMESAARFVLVLLLRHGGMATVEFGEGRYQLVGTVKPMNTYAVVGVGVFRDFEHIGRSVVVKSHGQGVRREDVVGDVTAPLSGDVFICGRVGDVCRTDRKQNCNRCKPKIFHGNPDEKSASAICIMTCQCGQTVDRRRSKADCGEYRQAA